MTWKPLDNTDDRVEAAAILKAHGQSMHEDDGFRPPLAKVCRLRHIRCHVLLRPGGLHKKRLSRWDFFPRERVTQTALKRDRQPHIRDSVSPYGDASFLRAVHDYCGDMLRFHQATPLCVVVSADERAANVLDFVYASGRVSALQCHIRRHPHRLLFGDRQIVSLCRQARRCEKRLSFR